MFGWGSGSSSSKQSAPNSLPGDGFEQSEEVYETPLPPTLPVVKRTIDTLVELAVKQRLFLSSHADRLKLELTKERLDTSLATGSWYLNGFSLSDEDAVDLVRASPDTLSNLLYTNYKDTTSIWAKLTKWLRFGAKDSMTTGLNVADDLAFGLTVSEVVEIAGHVLAGVSYAMTAQAPEVGKPLRRKLAFELVSSKHRGRSHSAYLLCDLIHAAQRTASGRTSATLKVDLSLFIYTPLLLGGLTGVAVNVSGTSVDDLPTTDIDQDELLAILAKKGTFVASSVSDFVLDASLEVSSERAAAVTLVSCERVVNAANTALTTFFKSEYETQARIRMQTRREKLEIELEQKREREAAAEAAAKAAAERAEQQQGGGAPGQRPPPTGRWRVDPNADPRDMIY
jgi:hypothetical protein